MGLENYLESTKSLHNGQGYDNFLFYMRLPKRPSTSSLARIFNVTDPTMHKWIDVYKLEGKNVENT